MSKLRVGFALCGSFCTFKKVIPIIHQLADNGAEIYPIMSQTAAYTNTRFGSSVEFRELIETICNKEIITTIEQAEPIGPRKLLDILIVEPCTGNTLGKLANGITDTSVTMAVKAHLRNERPVLIAVSTNDGLTASAKNIGKLQNSKNIFFVPYTQDDAYNKPASLVADFDKTMVAMHLALEGKQIQPLLIK